MKKHLIPLSLFAGLIAILAIGLTLNPQKVPSPLIGKSASELDLPRLYSQERFTSSQMLGSPWILNVWASWCTSCKEEHSLLMTFAQNHFIKIIGLNYKDTPQAAKDWLLKMGNPYEMIIEDSQGKAGIDWGVYAVPETFVIDSKGIIRYKISGPLSEDILQQQLNPLLAQLRKEKP